MARHENGTVVVDENGYPVDSVDPMEWADAFEKADNGGMDMDSLAAWFASALMTGQANSGATIPLDF